MTADVTKRSIVTMHEGKRLDNFAMQLVFHVQSYVGLSTDVVKSHIDDVESGVGAKAFVKTHKDMLDKATRVVSSGGKFRKATD